MRPATLAAVLLLASFAPATTQAAPASTLSWEGFAARLRGPTADPATGAPWDPTLVGARLPDQAPTLASPGGAFIGSLVLPGAGQWALGLRRWAVYAGLEALFWAGYVETQLDAGRLADSYRDLAWSAARAPSVKPRMDGGWGYYEAMSHWVASGAFDADPAADGIQPETDPGTYNGNIWDLARSIFLPGGIVDPGADEHDLAMAYYRDRAIGPAFLWSWADSEDELTRFRDLIAQADEELRLSTTALGLILANHLVSAVDAFLVSRMRAAEEPRLRLRSRIVPGPSPRWLVGAYISWPHRPNDE